MNTDWASDLGAAITVCDCDGRIVFMNDRAGRVFAKEGGQKLVGSSLFPCHQPRSQEIIKELLSTGRSNTYTIEKGPVKKLIHQTPWKQNGKIAGLVEFSIELPPDMPHFVRSSQIAPP